jgi:hypothetical protein
VVGYFGKKDSAGAPNPTREGHGSRKVANDSGFPKKSVCAWPVEGVVVSLDEKHNRARAAGVDEVL